MISKELSDKIKVLSSLCTLMVLFRHSLNIQAFFGVPIVDNYTMFIETAISKLTEIAVPCFFIISGFFFFGKIFNTLQEYRVMLLKKTKSLFIPFIAWNLFGALLLIATQKFQYHETWWKYIISLLRSDWNGPLWYVRDLMTLMLFSPIYVWIFKRPWLLTTGLIVLFHLWVPVSSNWVAVESMLFFFIGGILRKYKNLLSYQPPTYIGLVLFLVWLISSSFFPYCWSIHRYNTILGIFVFWITLDYLPTAIKSASIRLSKFTFFVYVTHIYFIKLIKVTIADTFPANQTIAFITYFSLPFIIMLLMCYIAHFWYKKHPNSYLFVTGGRG